MEKMHTAIIWITGNGLKRILIAALIFTLTIFIFYSVLQRLIVEVTASRLMGNPIALPKYILSVGPLGEITSEDGICATIDLRILSPAIPPPEQLYQFAFEKLSLYHNGQPIEEASETMYDIPYLGNTVVHYCGKANLSPGINLAEVTARTTSGTLSYQWAFIVVGR